MLDISDTQMKTTDTTELLCKARGITKYKDKLAITCVSPLSIQLIDVTGRTYWSVSCDKGNYWPNYISHVIGTSSITVTWNNNTITLLDGDTGVVITTRQGNEKNPHGVATDTADNIFVCYSNTREISVITADLSEERTRVREG